MDKTNNSVARVETYTRASIVKAERHNERKNESYSNINVDLIQTPNNVHYKKCKKTYNEKLKEMIDDGEISLRVLKDNAKVFDEIIFDINSDYFEQNSGYKGFVRGIKGSTKEHLTDLEFKIKKETEKLEKITNSVDEKQSNFDNYIQYAKQIDDISNLGKQKKFSKKIELEPNDYETLTQYAKKGIAADKEIYERDTRIENLRNTLNRWIEKYDGLLEKAKDYFHAIKLAPQRVADFFKCLFDKERQRIEQEKIEAERKAREEARKKERLEKQKLKNSPEYRKRRASYER